MNKNPLRDCQVQGLYNSLNSGCAQKGYEDAQRRFAIFHVLNYILYTIAVDAFDKMEATGLMRQDTKRRRKHCDRIWDKYQATMRRSMIDDAWFLLQDYVMAAQESIEPKMTIMRITFHNYLLKNKIDNAEVIAMLSCAVKIGCLTHTLWGKYFATYKSITGLNFAKDFAYADLYQLTQELASIIKNLTPKGMVIRYDLDRTCCDAQNVVEYFLADENFLDNASRKALGYSTAYKHLLDELEESNKEKERGELISRLAGKFDKVTKL